MQRFHFSDLEKLELYLSKAGFNTRALRVNYAEGKPPLATFELVGRGTLEAIHSGLRDSPFLLIGLDSKPLADGLSVRLKLSQRKVSHGASTLEPEFGDAASVLEPPFQFAQEMGE